jgi:hypothetical protein
MPNLIIDKLLNLPRRIVSKSNDYTSLINAFIKISICLGQLML